MSVALGPIMMGAIALGVVLDEPDSVASTRDRQGHMLVVVCIWPKRGTLAIADGAGIIPGVCNTEAGVIDLVMPDVPGVLMPVGRERALLLVLTEVVDVTALNPS